MRVAALDLGSNTSLLLIADVVGGVIQKVVSDQTTVTKLGQGVHAERRFHPEALERMRLCLDHYQQVIKEAHCDKVIAVATSAARDVQNGHELIDLGHARGIPIHIIAGAREAQLTFRGALCDRPQTEGLAVIDVGGGSTEIITQMDGHVKGTSIDVGSVRLTELFVHQDPISDSALSQVLHYADEAFARAALPVSTSVQEIVAVAGTPTTLAALDQKVEFREDLIHGYRLPLSNIENWVQRLSKMTLPEREALVGMQPKRADVIVTGTAILSSAIRALGGIQVTVSTRGVRYGVALTWSEF